VVLFLHGDGAQDRFAGESYTLIMNTFLKNGIACFSWDKQGVGGSSGNWLHQTMADRAEEAISALNMLTKRGDIKPDKIGYIGFSQAGWVIPEIATRTNDAEFYIIVGGATSWLAQGHYLTRTRLSLEGFAEPVIQQALSYSDTLSELILNGLSYDDYVSYRTNNPTPVGYSTSLIPKDRFTFIQQNIGVDSAEQIATINKPLLAIWGEDDLNVDAKSNIRVYENAISKAKRHEMTLLMFEDATHGILKSQHYNYQLLEQWPLSAQLRYLFEGEAAYSQGYFDVLRDWTREQLHQDQ